MPPQPRWQPLTQISLIASVVEGMLHHTQEQYALFKQAEDQPYVLDDALVERAERLYQVQHADLWLYETQCSRWLADPAITAAQPQRVAAIQTETVRLKANTLSLLALLKILKAGTINRMMEKSDLEVGLDFLMGIPRKPRKPK